MSVRSSANMPSASRKLAGRREPINPPRQSGLTMIELMVTITLVAILFGIGIPSYRYVTNSNRATSEVNGLLSDMQFARSEAVKEGQTVTVCPSTDGATCTKSSNTWNKGWIVFSDTGGDQTTTDTGDVILRVQKGFTVTTDSFTSDNNVDYVSFNREGFVIAEQAVNNGYFTITLHTTPQQNQWTRCLEVSALGSLTAERYGADSCQ